MKSYSITRSCLAVFAAAVLSAQATETGKWVFCCRPDNDLFRVAGAAVGARRVESAAAAVRHAENGAAVLVLADSYPETRTSIEPEVFAEAHRKDLRLYVEYPEAIPGLQLGSQRAAEWERAVVTTGVFGKAAPRLRILAIHGCTFIPIENPEGWASHLVMAKVAGFDTAVFGLPDTVYPLLLESRKGRTLVATTRLSHFVAGRFAPKAEWQAVWGYIFARLQPGKELPLLDWELAVRPTFTRTEKLPREALDRAIIRGIDWHTRARMLMHSSWTNEYSKYGNLADPVGPPPDPGWPAGEGECGLLEGFNSRVLPDGKQNVRWWLRTDCNGESALAFALRARLDGDARSVRVARNLLDWVYFNSGLLITDTNSPMCGLLGWAPNTRGTFYQDNDIKAILGCIGTAALLGTNRWDEVLLRNILGNFRTTGIYGFRGECLNEAGLRQNGWLHYWQAPKVHYSAHFEVWSWAAYLWLYDKTHFAPLLERSLTGIRRMMHAYPAEWRWTNGLQQERGRMLLTLAWLVRVQDTPEHRAWLKQIASDLMADQDACGAVREEMGELHLGYMQPPQSNEAYGSGEAPLIHQNGDPVADLLYTCNFTLFGLHEAAAATGDPFYREAEEKLINFLLRVQVRSDVRPELDGAWLRAFDFERWEYFASNSDSGWGAWAVECGWTQGWITTGLALYRLNLNVWDLSRKSDIGKQMRRVQPWMLPDNLILVPGLEQKVEHAAVGRNILSLTRPDARHARLSTKELLDGRFARWDHTNRWLGYEGVDMEAIIDLGQLTKIRSIQLNCLQETRVGIYLPEELEAAVSTDGATYQILPREVHQVPLAMGGPAGFLIGPTGLDATGRYLRIRARNVGKIPVGQAGAGLKAWLFVDEILVNAAIPRQ